VHQLVSALYSAAIRAQLNDGAVNALCFAVMMLLNLIWAAVFSIVDSMVSRVGKRGKN